MFLIEIQLAKKDLARNRQATEIEIDKQHGRINKIVVLVEMTVKVTRANAPLHQIHEVAPTQDKARTLNRVAA